jgi:hypothetical protein
VSQVYDAAIKRIAARVAVRLLLLDQNGNTLIDADITPDYVQPRPIPLFEPESAGALMLSSMDAAACAVGFLLDPAWEWGRADVPPSPLMQEGT